MEPRETKAAAEQLAVELRKIFQGMAGQVANLGVDSEQSAGLEEELLQGWKTLQPILARLTEE
jgi:hypothetical protein